MASGSVRPASPSGEDSLHRNLTSLHVITWARVCPRAPPIFATVHFYQAFSFQGSGVCILGSVRVRASSFACSKVQRPVKGSCRGRACLEAEGLLRFADGCLLDFCCFLALLSEAFSPDCPAQEQHHAHQHISVHHSAGSKPTLLLWLSIHLTGLQDVLAAEVDSIRS